MVTSVAMHPDAWMDGVQVNAQDLRLQAVSAHLTGASPSGTTGIAARPGVRYGTGSPLLVAAASGMNVTVNAGVAFVQGSTSATAGMYTGCLDTTATLTVATSDPTNPRIDNVIVQVTDVGTSSSTTVVTLQAGTPAPSPVAPTLPANSLLLATIAVGAGVSSIVTGNITDSRVYTVATGGILPLKDVTAGISGPAGLYGHDLSTGRLKVSDGAGNARQPKIAAFAPVTSQVDPTVTTTAYQVLTSVSVVVDGSTELEVTATWRSIDHGTGTIGTNDNLSLDFSLSNGSGGATWGGPYGSTCFLFPRSTGTAQSSGGTFRSWITPAAGTVTIYLLGSLSQTTTYAVRALNLRVQANTQS